MAEPFRPVRRVDDFREGQDRLHIRRELLERRDERIDARRAPKPGLRSIQKPVAGSVHVAVAGTPLATGWTVDTTTGIVTFASAPATGAAVTAGFEFDVPARFDTDKIEVNLEQFNLGSIPRIPVLEVRL
jgi:uncharacterized protein (TIGR02217 family)